MKNCRITRVPLFAAALIFIIIWIFILMFHDSGAATQAAGNLKAQSHDSSLKVAVAKARMALKRGAQGDGQVVDSINPSCGDPVSR